MRLKNKNILLIIHNGCLGGAERQALGLGKYLVKEFNCKVDVLLTLTNKTTIEFDNYVKECEISGVYHFGKPLEPYLYLKKEFTYKNLKRLKWSLGYLWEVRKGVAPLRPDVLIPFLNFPSKLSYYLYKMIPSVKFTFWHQLGLDNIKQDVFESIAVYNIPCVIGNAPNCLNMFNNEYNLAKNKQHILPQCTSLVRVDKNKNLLRCKLGLGENIVIGMVAHYREEKYHDLLLEVFNELSFKYDNIYLVFLGNKENDNLTLLKFNNLVKKVKNLNLTNRVSVLSNEDVTDILNVIDIGVLLSLIEGTPNSVMEYMMYELPVVSSNHPGCRLLLNESPFLVKNNKEDVYNKLAILIESEQLRKDEGANNLRLIKNYTINDYIMKLEEIMNKTLKGQ